MMNKIFKWRITIPCDNCPFSDSMQGTQLRESLGTKRFEAICQDLQKGRHFICHKSIDYETRNPGTEKICAGAIQWQEARGIKADLVQIMERLTNNKE